jgi:hypothetical protein
MIEPLTHRQTKEAATDMFDLQPPAVSRSDLRPPIGVASIALPRSPVSLPSADEAPHIFTRKSRLQPGEFLATCAKRLLQQYRHFSHISSCECPQPTEADIRYLMSPVAARCDKRVES